MSRASYQMTKNMLLCFLFSAHCAKCLHLYNTGNDFTTFYPFLNILTDKSIACVVGIGILHSARFEYSWKTIQQQKI